MLKPQDTALIVNALREKAQGDRLGAAAQRTSAFALKAQHPGPAAQHGRICATLEAQAQRADELADCIEFATGITLEN